MHDGFRRFLGGTGRALMTAGILVLLFVAYQLWGTGIFTARSQNRLDDEFATARERFRQETTTTTGSPVPTTSTTNPDPSDSGGPDRGASNGAIDIDLPLITSGDAVGRLRMEAIGVDWTFVQGTSRDDLRKGPGHYVGTPYPGQPGNAAIAGHRTTYGAPFNRIDELDPGDRIEIETFWGDFTYQVYAECVVTPSETWVAGQNLVDLTNPASACAQEPRTDAVLTLTSCNPKFSARERYVIKAELLVEQSDPPAKFDPAQVVGVGGDDGPGTDDPDITLDAGADALRDGLSGDPASRRPTALWAAFAVIVGALWWWAYRRWRHWATWLVGVTPFAVVLFGCYYYADRLLPAGY